MRIPRPDLDALIWLTGIESTPDETCKIHAAQGPTVFCGYHGPLRIQQLLWIDRAAVMQEDQFVECIECNRLEHPQTDSSADHLVAIYGARQGDKDQALLRYVRSLEQAPFSDNDYRIDTARTKFPDGFGCYFTIWRRPHPSR